MSRSENANSPCPLCSTDSKIQTKWADDYSIARCGNCNLLFSTRMPTADELADFYQGFLYRKPDRQKIQLLAAKKTTELINHFGAQSNRNKFLDYGGGTGITTNAAISLGFETHYFEIDEQAHHFVEKNSSVDNQKMYLDSSQIPRNYFDMIMCDNVIEHVCDPVALVNELYGYLRPNGSVVIKTPNSQNFELYFFPQVSVFGYAMRAKQFSGQTKQFFSTLLSRTWNCDPPRHLYSFSSASLKKICELADIDTHSIAYYHIPTFEYLMFWGTIKRPVASHGWALKAVLSVVEVLAKPLLFTLKKLGLLSAAGISLKVTKPRDH